MENLNKVGISIANKIMADYLISNKLTCDIVHNHVFKYLLDLDEFGYIDKNLKDMHYPLYMARKQDKFNKFIKSKTIDLYGKKVFVDTFVKDLIHLRGDVKLNNFYMKDKLLGGYFEVMFNNIVDSINDVFKENLIDVTSSGLKGVAHRDAIQIIPPIKNGVGRYVGSSLYGGVIDNNIIESTGKLQGIFASDGMFENLTITNNKIDIKGEHEITIAGLMYGKIENNTNGEGEPSKVDLYPLRLGGGIHNFNVLSFTDMEYGTIKGDGLVNDIRTEPRKGKRNFTDFDIGVFHKTYLDVFSVYRDMKIAMCVTIGDMKSKGSLKELEG